MKKRLCFVLFLLFFYVKNQAQEEAAELKLWTAVTVSNNFTDKWNIGVEQHFRFKDNLKSIDNLITELNMDFKPNKNWKFDADIRFYLDRDNTGKVQGLDRFVRYRYGIQRKVKIKRFGLLLKASHEIKKEISKVNIERLVRFRPTVQVPIRNWKWDPEFFVEYFHPLTDNLVPTYRYGVSTDKKISKNVKLLFRYFLVRKIENNNSSYSHVFFVRYGFLDKK